jgi:LEA14-like dessication related protein
MELLKSRSTAVSNNVVIKVRTCLIAALYLQYLYFTCVIPKISTMFRLSYIIFFIQILAITSCAGFENVSMPSIERISKFEPGNFKDGKLDFSFTTEINNPDRLKFKIRSVNLDVMVNDIKVGEVNSRRTIKILRLQHPEVKWELTGDLKALVKPKMLFSVLSGKKPDLKVKGSVVVSKWFFRKSIPVNLSLPVQLPFLK